MSKLILFCLFSLGVLQVFSQIQLDTVIDIDGNVYHTVKIGTQTWLVENLKVTRFRNGDSITCLQKTDQWINATASGYCIYDISRFYLDSDQKELLLKKMGKFYNGYTIMDKRNIAPEGWRVPGNEDFDILENYLGGHQVAGAKLKDTANWQTKIGFNTHVLHTTNESGFTALPDGYRDQKGEFRHISEQARWWTTKGTTNFPDLWSVVGMLNSQDALFFPVGDLLDGYSVRCVKDE